MLQLVHIKKNDNDKIYNHTKPVKKFIKGKVILMTNQDCIRYSSIALLNLIERDEKINVDTLSSELLFLFDTYSETEIEKEVFFRL